MNKRIIYTNETGGVSVVIPAPEYIQELISLGMTETQAIAHIAQKDSPTEHEIVDISVIPTDRTFRNAWVKDNASIKTDIPKAKLIAHDKRRLKRAEEFAPLDIEATITPKAQQAETARQAIRGKYDAMQTNINNANTEAELKSILVSGGVISGDTL